MSVCNFPEVPEVCGRFAVIAHTEEGEFVHSRYDKASSRDTALSLARTELQTDSQILKEGGRYPLSYDGVIRFSKRTDPIEEPASLV